MISRFLVTAGLAIALVPAALTAQDPPPPTQDGQQVQATAPGDTAVVELVLRREAFTYPTFARRNPFLPLTAADESGPRFDQMQLTGILYDPSDASRSMAVISVGGGVASGDPSVVSVGEMQRGQVERLRVGERWGNVRIISISSDVVIVDVAEFGIQERREMRLQSRGQGGS